ncbi:MAG: proline racemase family protein [Gammaproteobacteria bacterium]|nr:proline racemase family protein [Gammaproteobacteria bacterium]MBT8094547.1 proline racemase family protein [Gammaproteobacteria bacterium]MBT8104823.1 proline racemase family protein [Gammaproteobacteria bacterium]NNF49977.1 hydroxyproline-2-epimerase [Woeseiaceae bacterium]NNK24837.1 hydroxyproline-2-epimerase [Woeseiaceae bacterium]
MRVIDSHTEGEPTRVIVEGGPDLGAGGMDARIARFRTAYDDVRKAVILEPRGSDALVGALLCEPTRTDCATGVLFFNNTGYLGMCGHGSIGVAVTLAWLGRIGRGVSRLETPVGVVAVDLIDDNTVTVENVPSYRYRQDVTVEVAGLGRVTGDIAWGGNWFFLVKEAPCPLELTYERELTSAALAVMRALRDQGIGGRDGGEIDHIEFFAEPHDAGADSRNFVLCPGGAYDRSPCGTGTSAKLACLAADGLLAPATDWVQESVIGSRFTARYRLADDGAIVPSITGRAFVCAETTLVRQDNDPFRDGIA